MIANLRCTCVLQGCNLCFMVNSSHGWLHAAMQAILGHIQVFFHCFQFIPIFMSYTVFTCTMCYDVGSLLTVVYTTKYILIVQHQLLLTAHLIQLVEYMGSSNARVLGGSSHLQSWNSHTMITAHKLRIKLAYWISHLIQ